MATHARAIPPDADDLDLVRAGLREVRDYSNLAAAEALGVSEATVRRWRAGSIAVPLRTATRLSLRAFLEPHGRGRGWRVASPAADRTGGAGEGGDRTAGVFAPLAHIRRYVAEIAPPGDGQRRKLDVLEGIRRVITAREALPDWWYQLREEVEEARL